MKTVQTYEEFLNEGKFGKGLATVALGAGLLMGNPGASAIDNKPGIEQTIPINEEIKTNVAVNNLIKCDYKYNGYDMNNDGSTTLYFNKGDNSVILDCISNTKWNGNGSFINFITKNSILK